jgi:membrane fusion protein, heavy metal efflux system
MKKTSFFLTCLVGLAACSDQSQQTPAQAEITQVDFVELSEQQLGAMDIRLAKPEQKPIVANVYLTGKVGSLPNLKATVSPNIEGKVDRIFVSEGSLVRKGQALLTLSSMALIELQNDYLTAKSEEDFLAIEFKRQEELIKNNVGALADFQVVEAKFNAAISREKALRAKLELLRVDVESLQTPKNPKINSTVTITAPIDGYVVKLPVTVGMVAGEETTLAELVNVDQLLAEVSVFDKDLDLIREGQTVEIDFVNNALVSVQGQVTHIFRTLEAETRAVKVHVQFRTPPGALVLPGMTVRAVVKSKATDTALANTVPLSSVLQEDDQFYVFATTQEKGPGGKMTIRKFKVELGDKNETATEIVFPNGTPTNLLIAQNNVMVLETQRKQMSGLGESGN